MGKAARIRGRRQESEARAAVQAQADRETLEAAFGQRLTNLEDCLKTARVTLVDPVPNALGEPDWWVDGVFTRIEVADGPRLKLTIWVDP